MKLLPGTTKKTFSLLSIGQRGVGKTVFLAGSYAELHSNSQVDSGQQLWFDCQDTQAQENLEKILSYVSQSGQYPPLSIKITKFNFSLKRRTWWGVQTLSHFRWWDIPGESCNIRNPDFKGIVYASQGCCVFIDAYALVYNNAYLQQLEDIIEQVIAIANLVYLNNLNYPFALILTKCDLLEPGELSRQQLKKRLQLLTAGLDAARANYQTFYSSIPIVHTEGVSTLSATGATAPLLWLVWELSKVHNPGLMNNLLKLITYLLPTNFPLQQKGVDGTLQSLFSTESKASRVKKILGLYLFPTDRKYLSLLVAIVGLVGSIGLFWVDYKWVLPRETKNLDTLTNLATLRQRGQFDQAVPLMEKLVEQSPEHVEWRLQLAHLYELTGQVFKAETAYDQVLAQQKNNLKALVGKAVLRQVQGDAKTASALFAQAEKAAPAELKVQVRAVAQKTLASPAKPMPAAK